MPENQIPATKPEAGEFNFAKTEGENPRIKRRSLKGKSAGLIKPTGTPTAARELEREAPPLSAEQVVKPQPERTEKVEEVPNKPAVKVAETIAPPRTTPSTSISGTFVPKTTALPSSASVSASTSTTPKAPVTSASASSSATPKTTTATAASTSGPANSPHGTRPATLYYSTTPTTPRKAEPPSPMKTIPTASSASSSATPTAAATPISRVATTTSTSRPSPTVDYRANVERQTREQKSVGSLLTYVVYGLIAFFVLSAGLAGYGAKVIFAKLSDQSQTVSDLDARYAAANKDLNAKLATTQDTLSQAQTQIARQQDLIMKQQEEMNSLITASNNNDAAIKQEKAARTQEAANLRGRVKELEYKTSVQKY